MNLTVINADYLNPQHAQDIVSLLNSYAKDPMGGGEPLSQFVKDNLVKELAKTAHALTVMCYVDDKPAGLVNCFEGFSTFQCKPLLNIHDVIVLSDYQRLNISQKMLELVQAIAIEKGCSKLTLEVLEGNKVAQNSYSKFGFAGYELDPAKGQAMFWQKAL